MARFSRFVLLLISGLFAVSCSSHGSASNTSLPPTAASSTAIIQQAYEGFQADADIIRLRHLQHWVTLIESYHEQTGKYPFQGESAHPIYVFVATPRQQADKNLTPPPPASKRSMSNFVDTLESGLGRSINEYYDPQYAADAKPNFYMYMIDGDNYYFAIHTHQRYPFSKNIAPNYYKVEVSNTYNASANLVVTPEILFSSDSYVKAVNLPVQKPEFFTNREKQDIHASKLLKVK